MNCYERRTNDFQATEIQEDHKETEIRTDDAFVLTFVTVA